MNRQCQILAQTPILSVPNDRHSSTTSLRESTILVDVVSLPVLVQLSAVAAMILPNQLHSNFIITFTTKPFAASASAVPVVLDNRLLSYPAPVAPSLVGYGCSGPFLLCCLFHPLVYILINFFNPAIWRRDRVNTPASTSGGERLLCPPKPFLLQRRPDQIDILFEASQIPYLKLGRFPSYQAVDCFTVAPLCIYSN